MLFIAIELFRESRYVLGIDNAAVPKGPELSSVVSGSNQNACRNKGEFYEQRKESPTKV